MPFSAATFAGTVLSTHKPWFTLAPLPRTPFPARAEFHRLHRGCLQQTACLELASNRPARDSVGAVVSGRLVLPVIAAVL